MWHLVILALDLSLSQSRIESGNQTYRNWFIPPFGLGFCYHLVFIFSFLTTRRLVMCGAPLLGPNFHSPRIQSNQGKMVVLLEQGKKRPLDTISITVLLLLSCMG